jgi:hypothetical protein
MRVAPAPAKRHDDMLISAMFCGLDDDAFPLLDLAALVALSLLRRARIEPFDIASNTPQKERRYG